MRIIFKNIEKAAKKFKKRAQQLLAGKPQGTVRVGIFADKGAQPKKRGKGSDTYGGEPTTVVNVAQKHESGDGVPPRRFISGYVDVEREKIQGKIKKLSRQVVKGTIKKELMLNRLGLSLKAGMQARMSDGIPPPNSKLTVELKGSSKPLIDTGQLRSSIAYDVDGKQPQKAKKPITLARLQKSVKKKIKVKIKERAIKIKQAKQAARQAKQAARQAKQAARQAAKFDKQKASQSKRAVIAEARRIKFRAKQAKRQARKVK